MAFHSSCGHKKERRPHFKEGQNYTFFSLHFALESLIFLPVEIKGPFGGNRFLQINVLLLPFFGSCSFMT